MKRRDFLQLTGMGFGSTLLAGIPLIRNAVPNDKPWYQIDTAAKKG